MFNEKKTCQQIPEKDQKCVKVGGHVMFILSRAKIVGKSIFCFLFQS